MKNRSAASGARPVIYNRDYCKLTGSVLSAILFQQLEFWTDRSNTPDNSFYKFLSPANGNKFYKRGDSWTEELAFSEREFRTAFDAIGVRHFSKTQFKASPDPFTKPDSEGQAKRYLYASYFDKNQGLTFYFRNDEVVDALLDEITLKKPVPVDCETSSTVDAQTQSLEITKEHLCRLPNAIHMNRSRDVHREEHREKNANAPSSDKDPLLTWLIENASECILVPPNFILGLLNSANKGAIARLPEASEYRAWILNACLDLGPPQIEDYPHWRRQLNYILKESREAGRYVAPAKEIDPGARDLNIGRPQLVQVETDDDSEIVGMAYEDYKKQVVKDFYDALPPDELQSSKIKAKAQLEKNKDSLGQWYRQSVMNRKQDEVERCLYREMSISFYERAIAQKTMSYTDFKELRSTELRSTDTNERVTDGGAMADRA